MQVLKAYSFVVFSFPRLLSILNISAYYMSHVLVHYIDKTNILPGSMLQHLERIHESIIKEEAWKKHSPLFLTPIGVKGSDFEKDSNFFNDNNLDIFLSEDKLHALFFRNVFKFSCELIAMMTSSFGNIFILSDDHNAVLDDHVIRDCANEIVSSCITHRLSMFKDRNLVHVILCSFYTACKVCA
jgi:hypothetical protein